MDKKDDDPAANHIVLPATIFYLLIGGSVLGGSGAYGILQPRLTGDSANQCIADAKAALEVGTSNARQIANLHDFITERTADRYTREDHDTFSRAQDNRDQQQDRWLSAIQREIDRMKK
jgi:hypothetical protein